ncbi:MAG: YabP/YqfC family sporulation protein [Acutalibacteraceae bacterium]|nr:YabP/YqfC family sporulation protein [Oscillospiraceae bacterium]
MRRYDLRTQNPQKNGFSDVLGAAEITLTGNKRAIIDGAKGVVEYNPGCVRLNLGRLCLRFCGESLTIKTLSDDKTVVEGTILSMDFSS